MSNKSWVGFDACSFYFFQIRQRFLAFIWKLNFNFFLLIYIYVRVCSFFSFLCFYMSNSIQPTIIKSLLYSYLSDRSKIKRNIPFIVNNVYSITIGLRKQMSPLIRSDVSLSDHIVHKCLPKLSSLMCIHFFLPITLFGKCLLNICS